MTPCTASRVTVQVTLDSDSDAPAMRRSSPSTAKTARFAVRWEKGLTTRGPGCILPGRTWWGE